MTDVKSEQAKASANSEEVIAFLKSEIEQNERSTKRLKTFGVGLVAIFGVYMVYIGYSLKTRVLNPYRLAGVIAQNLDSNAPAIIDNVGDELIRQAPEVAQEVHRSIVRGIPAAERLAETRVDAVFSHVPQLDSLSEAVVARFFAEKGEEIRPLFAQGHSEEAIARVVDDVYAQLVHEVNGTFRARYPKMGVDSIEDLSLAHLTYLESYLDTLGQMHPRAMKPSERLQRRAIVAWTALLRRKLKI